MVLCTEGQKKYFKPQLLKLLANKKSTEVVDILRNYSPKELSLELNQLTDSSQATLLHYAAEYGNTDIVQHLLDSNFVIDVQDYKGRSPLMLAVVRGHESVVQILLKATANIHLSDCQGKTVLQMIFEHKTRQCAVLTALFQHTTWQKIIEGITSNDLIEKLNEAGYTLEDALQWGNTDLVRVWLKREKSIDACDAITGKTLLHLMVEKKMMKMAKVLVEFGANVDALDRKKATPLFYLHDAGKDNESECMEFLKVYVSRANSLTTCTTYGPMQISPILENGNDAAIEIILQANIDMDAIDKFRNTLLHSLVKNHNVDLFKLMRNRKFEVNARNKNGYTPLHVAATKTSENAMAFLLENGANIYEATNAGKTCLYLIFQFNYSLKKEIIELLLQKGADPQECLNYLTSFEWFLMHSGRISRGSPDQLDHLIGSLAKAEPILHRLAVVEGLGMEITEITRSKINLQPSWVEYFDKCRGQVQKMRETTIYGNITLFNFLTESNEKLTSYLRNEELASELENAIEEFAVDSPYRELLRSRLAKAVQLVELREKSIAAIFRLFNLQDGIHFFAVEYIVGYFSVRDMENLLLVWDD